MKRVYVASPYRGDVGTNILFARRVCREVVLAGDAPLAPHLLFTQFLDDDDPVQRELGLAAAMSWIEVADELLVAGDVSDGMRLEIARATELGVPIRFASAGGLECQS